jgi:dolichol-phosphate mannosyltransferase
MSRSARSTRQRGASLSVVIPCYQEAAGVSALAAQAIAFVAKEGLQRAVELVVVDDGSTDHTFERLQRELGGLDVQLLRHERNLGLTAALATGSHAAHGDLVAHVDADLSYDLDLVGALARRCDDGAHVAVASCHHPQGGAEGVPGGRVFLSRMASRIYRLATGFRLHTFTSMVRVYRREVLARCVPARSGFVGVTEILIRALRAGYRVDEVPAVLRARKTGASKMRAARVAFAHAKLAAAALLRRV